MSTTTAYEFTKAGHDATLISKVTDPGGATTYDYDAKNRLTKAVATPDGDGSLANSAYDYDGAGNRTKASGGFNVTYRYNDADQLTTTGVAHDGNGNMVAGGTHGYSAAVFNDLDQATSITPKGGPARPQEFTGQLQFGWLADAQTRFTAAASVGITVTARPGELTTFVRDPQGRLVSMKRGDQQYHYLRDGRGSVDALTDANGERIQAYRYDPWGRTTANLGTVDQPFRWNSEYAINDYDYKIGARFYDASLGRWTQRDPSGQDPNPYAYANNDPINRADPSGLDSCGKDWNLGGIVDCGSKGAQGVKGDDVSIKKAINECVAGAGGAAVFAVVAAAASGGALTPAIAPAALGRCLAGITHSAIMDILE